MCVVPFLVQAKMGKRTRDSDVAKATLLTIFAAHVPLGKCVPGVLWAVKVSQNGLTASWSAMKTCQAFLSDLIDATGGHNLHLVGFANALDSFLRSHEMSWPFSKVEEACRGIRSMLSTLLAVKRGDRKIPQAFESLGAVAGKMRVEISDDDETASVQRPRLSAVGPVPVPVPAPAPAPPTAILDQTSECEDESDGEGDELDKLAKRLFKKSPRVTPSHVVSVPMATPEKRFELTVGNMSSFSCLETPSPFPALAIEDKKDFSDMIEKDPDLDFDSMEGLAKKNSSDVALLPGGFTKAKVNKAAAAAAAAVSTIVLPKFRIRGKTAAGNVEPRGSEKTAKIVKAKIGGGRCKCITIRGTLPIQVTRSLPVSNPWSPPPAPEKRGPTKCV